MITPQEIEDKKFGKGIRGYREEDVDQFLDIVIADLKTILMEKDALELRVRELEEELGKKKATETAVYEALEKANNIAKDISDGVEKKSALIIENAQAEAALISQKAQAEEAEYTGKIEALKGRYDALKAGYQKLLEDEMSRFDVLEKELFGEKDPQKPDDGVKDPAPAEEAVQAEEPAAEEKPAEEDQDGTIEINDIEQLIQE